MSERSGYENLVNLPKVVEAVHQRNALAVLGSMGITLARGFTWETAWEAYEAAGGDTHLLVFTEYRGKVPVDGVFGKTHWKLTESLPTDQARWDVSGPSYASYNTIHERTQIGIRWGQDDAIVMMMPDVPPVAIYDDDIRYVQRQNPRLAQRPNDAATLAAVQRAFGDNAVDFITEPAARSLVYALLNDESRTQNDDESDVL